MVTQWLEVVVAQVRRRKLPLMVAAMFVVTGVSCSFGWGPVVAHRPEWVQSSDLWGIFRSAQYVAWGDIGDISRSITLPGIAVVLAPAALLVEALRLPGGFPLWVPEPAAWVVLEPYAMMLGALALFPLDALAVRLGVDRRRRVALAVTQAAALWPVVALWGHPEDALAVAAVTGSFLAFSHGRLAAAGWWFGVAVAMQPIVLAVLPLLALAFVRHRWGRVLFVVRASSPAIVLLAIPLARNWHLTTAALLQQANYPSVDHPTPWLFLAPVIQRAHWVIDKEAVRTRSGFHTSEVHHLVGAVVGDGPGHMLALLGGVAVGLWVWRHPPGLGMALWLASACLAFRCVFESVDNPYYVWPVLALAVVAAAVRGGRRFPVALALAGGLTAFSELHLSMWEWYVPVVVLLVGVLACSWPGGIDAMSLVFDAEPATSRSVCGAVRLRSW